MLGFRRFVVKYQGFNSPTELEMVVLLLNFVLILFSGCGYLAHMEELLRLKSLSDNQTMQQELVQQQNKKFESLLEAVKGNRLQDYPDKKSILKAFGEPIFVQTLEDGGKAKEKWMYRYSEKLMGSEKVYLYFDEAEKLVDHKHVQPPSKSQEKKEQENKDATAQKT